MLTPLQVSEMTELSSDKTWLVCDLQTDLDVLSNPYHQYFFSSGNAAVLHETIGGDLRVCQSV